MEMDRKETLLWALRWIVGVVLLFAPAFAFIDVALSECAGRVTSKDLWRIRWLVSDATLMRDHGFIEKVQPVKGRVFPVAAAAVLIAGLLMSEPPDPLSTKWENLKITILLSVLLSLAPFSTPSMVSFFMSFLGALFFHGEAGCFLLNMIEVSADYAIGSYELLMDENFLQFLGFLACNSLLMLSAMLPRMLIGLKRGMYLREKHPFSKVLYELTWRSMEEEKRRLQQASSRSGRSTQVKPRSALDVSVFTDHLYKCIENAKRRGGGEKKTRNTHAREHQEAAEEIQEFERRVKEKDRTWYIA